jgi:NDP-sugar pyrophosphorylase family protein
MKLPQLVVVAGGYGTRLGKEFSKTPKILIPITDKSFLEIQLEKFISDGIDRIHYLLGHQSIEVIKAIEDAKERIHITYEVDPPGLLGTGGALINSIEYLEDEFFITYGDSYLLASVKEIEKTVQKFTYENVMCVTQILDGENTYNTKCFNNQVLRYEKSTHDGELNMLDYGLLRLKKQYLLSFMNNAIKFDLSEIIDHLITLGKLNYLEISEPYFDIGSPARIERFKEFLDAPAR